MVVGGILSSIDQILFTHVDREFNAQAHIVCETKDSLVMNHYDWHQELALVIPVTQEP